MPGATLLVWDQKIKSWERGSLVRGDETSGYVVKLEQAEAIFFPPEHVLVTVTVAWNQRLAGRSRLLLIAPLCRAKASVPPFVQHPTEAGAGAVLYEASERGNLALVNTLLASGISLTYVDKEANTALHKAVLGGSAAVCRRLIRAGADPEFTNMFDIR